MGRTRQGSPLQPRDKLSVDQLLRDLSRDASEAQFWSFSLSLPSPGKSEITTQQSAGGPALPGGQSSSLAVVQLLSLQDEGCRDRGPSPRLLSAGSHQLSRDWAG